LVTTFASSLEVLSLTVEQLEHTAEKDAFLKAVYDWNYQAAADCIAELSEDGSEQLSRGIRVAIFAAIAEKRFDHVQRTRGRAMEILVEQKSDIAARFLKCETPQDLLRDVSTFHDEPWFEQWKSLFTKSQEERLSDDEVGLVGSPDSLIGWAAANAARRARLNELQEQQIAAIYDKAGGETKKTIRWRVVHALGVYAAANSLRILQKALHDEYHWVQYGAARSLIEIAARSEPALRAQALEALREFLKNYDAADIWVRRQILEEIVQAAFILDAEPGWKDAVEPILRLAVDRETEPGAQDKLQKRLAEFRER
jgi:hypothetical protein